MPSKDDNGKLERDGRIIRTKRIPPERLRLVAEMMARMYPSREIAKQCAKQFGVTERTIYNYIDKIGQESAAHLKHERPYRKARMMETLANFYQRAMAARAFGPALQALDRMCRLDGLFEAEVVEHHHTHRTTADEIREMTTAQRRARINELLRLRREQVDGTRAPAYIDATCTESKGNGKANGSGTNGTGTNGAGGNGAA